MSIFFFSEKLVVPISRNRTKPLFRRRFGYVTSTTTKYPKTSEGRSTDLLNTDQELESSLVDKKFISTRFNHNSDFFADGVAEAITTISRAPLPFSGPTTTVRNVKITTPGSSVFSDDFRYPITRRSDILSSSTSELMIPIIL